MDIIKSIEREETIKEASYTGNIGFEEMVRFYQKANDIEINKMQDLIKKKSWNGVKRMFKKVLGIDLK